MTLLYAFLETLSKFYKMLFFPKSKDGKEEYISLFHKWIKKTRLSRLHCQRTHYYPAQPTPQMPGHSDISIVYDHRPGFHD